MKTEKIATSESLPSQVLDYDRFLKDMCYNKEDLAIRLITMLINERGPQLLNELREAIAANDLVKISTTCHTIKGTTANMCAEKISAKAAELSQLARDGESVIPPVLFEELFGLFEEIIQWWGDKAASLEK